MPKHSRFSFHIHDSIQPQTLRKSLSPFPWMPSHLIKLVFQTFVKLPLCNPTHQLLSSPCQSEVTSLIQFTNSHSYKYVVMPSSKEPTPQYLLHDNAYPQVYDGTSPQGSQGHVVCFLVVYQRFVFSMNGVYPIGTTKAIGVHSVILMLFPQVPQHQLEFIWCVSQLLKLFYTQLKGIYPHGFPTKVHNG